jgi:hypothetical protein
MIEESQLDTRQTEDSFLSYKVSRFTLDISRLPFNTYKTFLRGANLTRPYSSEVKDTCSCT